MVSNSDLYFNLHSHSQCQKYRSSLSGIEVPQAQRHKRCAPANQVQQNSAIVESAPLEQKALLFSLPQRHHSSPNHGCLSTGFTPQLAPPSLLAPIATFPQSSPSPSSLVTRHSSLSSSHSLFSHPFDRSLPLLTSNLTRSLLRHGPSSFPIHTTPPRQLPAYSPASRLITLTTSYLITEPGQQLHAVDAPS